jgi:hypothetical protein
MPDAYNRRPAGRPLCSASASTAVHECGLLGFQGPRRSGWNSEGETTPRISWRNSSSRSSASVWPASAAAVNRRRAWSSSGGSSRSSSSTPRLVCAPVSPAPKSQPSCGHCPLAMPLTHSPKWRPCLRGCSGAISETCLPNSGPPPGLALDATAAGAVLSIRAKVTIAPPDSRLRTTMVPTPRSAGRYIAPRVGTSLRG